MNLGSYFVIILHILALDFAVILGPTIWQPPDNNGKYRSRPYTSKAIEVKLKYSSLGINAILFFQRLDS